MSQSTVQQYDSTATAAVPNEFDYHPVPVLAPVTLFLGVAASMAMLSILGIPIAFVGVVLGAVCLGQIRRSNGELGGRMLTIAGLILSSAFMVSGTVWHSYVYKTEVPEGFQRVSFATDISRKKLIYEDGRMKIHPDVKALDGKKIFLKGYMYPVGQTKGLEQFVLVKDNQQCCFGGQPDPTDMIMVKMEKGKTVDYRQTLVAIAGTFHQEHDLEGGAVKPIYFLEGIEFSPAKTGF